MTSETASKPKLRAQRRPADLVFQAVSTIAGFSILITLGLVAFFLIIQSIPAMVGELPGPADNFLEYVAPLAFGTVWAAFLAMIMAVPVSVSIALFITHFAPRKLASAIGFVIDLLAAVPSVVYGLWGMAVVSGFMRPAYEWLAANASWIPLFNGTASGTGRTVFTAAIVLAVMVLPIITALCREVFLQTPTLHEEAALALGATRWEMIKMAVLPFGASGIVSSSILGLGRALGETMAVAMVLSPSVVISFVIISSSNPSTIASNIALNFPEAHGISINALIGSGLVLFVITVLVNTAARVLINRNPRTGGAK
ncbi:MAG TPA: phosphate ABC transporter permease subunit PstC [Candidatus Agrococcus pullicola]|uniref:Phosphate transport system permease protein n=1 Tax=Candidatus Agrococcus pullicola TaxID=2838429 RepID=A0A9D1YX60_9MICO|nr:phosphate ABC transporter permease subunit PstC [Candidatus Agrococcus pullicola]